MEDQKKILSFNIHFVMNFTKNTNLKKNNLVNDYFDNKKLAIASLSLKLCIKQLRTQSYG